MKVDYSELTGELTISRTFKAKVEEAVKQELAKAAEALRTSIKTRMPVDTGAAKASWGRKNNSSLAAKKGLKGVWQISDDGLTAEHGSERDSYNYIKRLNEGYSKQAPAGFIDAEVEKRALKLEAAIMRKTEKALT